MKNLEEKLSGEILMLMANNFDRWQNGPSSSEAAEAVMRSAHLAAQGIAKKLTAALGENSQELNKQLWAEMVATATRNAFMEVTDGGPLVKLGQNASFASAVAEVTACTVAPESKWVLDIEKEHEQKLRNKLQSLGVGEENIREVVQQWRSARKSERLD